MQATAANRAIPFWVAVLATFLVVVVGNVLPHGIGRPSPGKLVIALATIVIVAMGVQRRVRCYRAKDELQQRIELESLAAAFCGTFVVFVAYWLLQLAGFLPPLDGLYFVLGMYGLVSLGRDGALGRLIRRA